MRPEFENTPKLGFGCMRLPLLDPADQQSIDLEQFKQMVDAFIEGGGTYFDTAFVYHEGASEKALKEALVKRYPRDAYTVATKCLAWAAPSAEEAKSNLATSLARMGLDYVDFYLLHNVGGERTAKFDAYGMWDFALDAKERGLIRNVGFSMHDGADALDALLTAHPQMDFVQLQVNYLDWDDPVVEARRCMEVAAKHGVPVVVMEPARGEPRRQPGLVGVSLLLQPAERAHRALGHVEPGPSAPERGRLPGEPPVLARGAAGAGRGRRNAARHGQRAVHELPLLREGLPAGRGDTHHPGPAEPGAYDREPRFREGPLLVAGRPWACLVLHRLRRLRSDVPSRHRHRPSAGSGGRALRGIAAAPLGQSPQPEVRERAAREPRALVRSP